MHVATARQRSHGIGQETAKGPRQRLRPRPRAKSSTATSRIKALQSRSSSKDSCTLGGCFGPPPPSAPPREACPMELGMLPKGVRSKRPPSVVVQGAERGRPRVRRGTRAQSWPETVSQGSEFDETWFFRPDAWRAPRSLGLSLAKRHKNNALAFGPAIPHHPWRRWTLLACRPLLKFKPAAERSGNRSVGRPGEGKMQAH